MLHLLFVFLVCVELLTLIINVLLTVPVFPCLLLLSSLPLIHLLHISLKLTKGVIAVGTSLVRASSPFPEKFLCLPLEIFRTPPTFVASICVESVLIASCVPEGRFAIEFALFLALIIILVIIFVELLLLSISIRVFSLALVISKAIEVPIGLVLSLSLLLVRLLSGILLLLVESACKSCLLVVF